MAAVGDRVQVPSKRVGQAPREGVVIGASPSGGLLRVRWSTGEESSITPSMGSLVVVGRARAGHGKPGGASKASKKSSTSVAKSAKTSKATRGSGSKRGGGKASGKGGSAKRGK
jgi:hypothetical protein